MSRQLYHNLIRHTTNHTTLLPTHGPVDATTPDMLILLLRMLKSHNQPVAVLPLLTALYKTAHAALPKMFSMLFTYQTRPVMSTLPILIASVLKVTTPVVALQLIQEYYTLASV